jgi:hypothetical protein
MNSNNGESNTGFRTQQKRGGDGVSGSSGYRGGRGRGGGYRGRGRGSSSTGMNRYNRYKKTDTVADAAGDASAPAATAAPARQYPTEPNFAVTKNGALGLYNVSRRPIIFYANQWEGISAMIENGELARALEQNADKLRRPSKREVEAEETGAAGTASTDAPATNAA